MLKLIPTLLNNIPFASFELGQLIYRAKPVETRQALTLPEINNDSPFLFSLEGIFDYPLLLTRINLKVIDDKEKQNGDVYEVSDKVNAKVQILAINRQTNAVEERIMIDYTDDWKLDREIILRPEYLYQFKTDLNIMKTTFIGQYVYLPNDISLTNNLVQGGFLAEGEISDSNEVSSGNTRG